VNPNDFNDSNVTPSPGDVETQRDVTMPLGTGEFAEEPSLDPLASAGSTKRLSGGVLLIAAVVIIAVGGLFSMRKIAQVTAATDASSEIESRIEAFLNDLTGQTTSTAVGHAGELGARGESLAVLRDDYSERQVALHDVQKDPFVIYLDPSTVGPIEPDPQPGASAEELFLRRQAERRTLFQQAAAGLNLRSVMGGASPLAIIDDTIVRLGDQITSGPSAVEFRVTAIGAGTVEVTAEAPELDLVVTITLSMPER
jgi:hypothetical protein